MQRNSCLGQSTRSDTKCWVCSRFVDLIFPTAGQINPVPSMGPVRFPGEFIPSRATRQVSTMFKVNLVIKGLGAKRRGLLINGQHVCLIRAQPGLLG